MNRATVLCVDDEPLVLDGLKRVLHARFVVVAAASGEEALARLDHGERFDVVLSDMRMPGMSGAELLAAFRRRAPDTTRLLLTGHSDLDSAIAAVNDGQVFRFLTKPCPPDVLVLALSAAVEQHRLVIAERELLEKTLVGSIRAMTDVLALAHPSAFAPLMRQHARARALADRMRLEHAWRVEVASMLGTLGYVVLPDDLLTRLRRAEPLSSHERNMLDELPKVAEGVIAKIPRLQEIALVVRHQASWLGRLPDASGSARTLPVPAAILRIVHDLAVAEEIAGTARDAMASLRGHAELYDPHMIEALGEICAVPPAHVASLTLAQVKPGMVLVEDVRLDSGVLLVARGQRVTEHLLLQLIHNYSRRVREPIVCEVV